MGRIGIYERATDKLLQSVKVAQQPDGDGPNELKGLAWSPDSRLVAVMYHRSGGSTVFVIVALKGIELKHLDISSQPHTLEFESSARLKVGDEALDLR
jgi:DNA-binding beta-propeller fold protein YncE